MSEETTSLDQRTKRVLSYLRGQKDIVVYAVLALIIWIGFFIRTRNLSLIRDVTTGLHLPIEPDSFAFLRYIRYIAEHGELMANDPLRYFPNGYNPVAEFSFLSHAVVWLYKFLHFFSDRVTLEFAQVIYPPVAFAIGLVFFFLLIRRLFDWRVALMSAAFLSVIPPYLYRTIAGFSDKEALGMMFLFVSLYLFVAALRTTSLRNGVILTALSGFSTALMGLVWGGVQFSFLIIGVFAFFEIVFDRFDKREYLLFAVWSLLVIALLVYIFETRFALGSFLYSTSALPMLFALVTGIFRLVLLHYHPRWIQEKINQKMPLGIFAALVSSLVLFVLFILRRGLDAFVSRYRDIISNLLSPYGTSRWGRTVAESHQAYVRDWFSQFGSLYFWLFLVGVVVLFYFTFTVARKYRYTLTGLFVLFLTAFLASRYWSQPPFDGESGLAKVLFFGSLFFSAGFLFFLYLYTYRRDRDVYTQLLTLKKEYLFVLLWTLIMMISARLAIRILFVFAPITAVLVGFLFVKLYDLIVSFPHRALKVVGVVVLLFFLFSPTVNGSLVSYYSATYQTARLSGSSFHQQWQIAMDWVRKNTPEDAVFAHWWDYGYWVQAEGERATLTDGGNNGGPSLNYFMGRNVLTGQNNTEALEFLKVKGATYLLIVSDEIGKYGAFSSIGSNQTFDRFSAITSFTFDPSQTVEQRNVTLLFYGGSFALDENFQYGNQLFPASSAGIGAVIVPIRQDNGTMNVQQPSVILLYRDKQAKVPLKCIFIDRREIVFPGEGMPGCFYVIPVIQGNQANLVGSGLYLSRRVWNTLFTHLYLFDQLWEGFTLAYSDAESAPLAHYNGRLFGPTKIWKIDYPPYIPYNSAYEQLDLDQSLLNV